MGVRWRTTADELRCRAGGSLCLRRGQLPRIGGSGGQLGSRSLLRLDSTSADSCKTHAFTDQLTRCSRCAAPVESFRHLLMYSTAVTICAPDQHAQNIRQQPQSSIPAPATSTVAMIQHRTSVFEPLGWTRCTHGIRLGGVSPRPPTRRGSPLRRGGSVLQRDDHLLSRLRRVVLRGGCLLLCCGNRLRWSAQGSASHCHVGAPAHQSPTEARLCPIKCGLAYRLRCIKLDGTPPTLRHQAQVFVRTCDLVYIWIVCFEPVIFTS